MRVLSAVVLVVVAVLTTTQHVLTAGADQIRQDVPVCHPTVTSVPTETTVPRPTSTDVPPTPTPVPTFEPPMATLGVTSIAITGVPVLTLQPTFTPLWTPPVPPTWTPTVTSSPPPTPTYHGAGNVNPPDANPTPAILPPTGQQASHSWFGLILLSVLAIAVRMLLGMRGRW
jgi:hypothetical protein